MVLTVQRYIELSYNPNFWDKWYTFGTNEQNFRRRLGKIKGNSACATRVALPLWGKYKRFVILSMLVRAHL